MPLGEHDRLVGHIGNAYSSGITERIVESAPHTFMDVYNGEIVKGNAFVVATSTLAEENGVFELMLQTSTSPKRAHMILSFGAALAATFEMWIPTYKTFNDAGEITPMNREMESTNLPGLRVCHDPLGDEPNPPRHKLYLGAGRKEDIGGDSNSRGVYILPRNMTFLLRLTSRDASNSMQINLNWFERELSSL